MFISLYHLFSYKNSPLFYTWEHVDGPKLLGKMALEGLNFEGSQSIVENFQDMSCPNKGTMALERAPSSLVRLDFSLIT